MKSKRCTTIRNFIAVPTRRVIRWEKVVASAEFVIRNCDLNPLRLKLQILRDFTRIIKTEELEAKRMIYRNHMSTHEPRQTLKNAINSSPIQAYRIESPFPVPIQDSQDLIPLTQDGSGLNGVKRILQINGRSDLSGGPIAMFRLLQEMHDQPFQHTVVCPKNSNGFLKTKKLKHVQTECMELRRISPSSIVSQLLQP